MVYNLDFASDELNVGVDSDGICANWEKLIIQLIDNPLIKNIKQLNKHPLREKIISDVYEKHPDFFSHPDLEVMQEGKELIKFLRENNIKFKIFTAALPDNFPKPERFIKTITRHKIDFFKRHFEIDEKDVVVVSKSSDKKLLAKPNIVLIDDYDKNISEFKHKGGKALMLRRGGTKKESLPYVKKTLLKLKEEYVSKTVE